MEGYCRGCLLQFIEPTDLIQYTEKNRRLFVYSTGIQVKRNDSFTFQLCKECYFNMKQSCKFKKQCRTSEKKFKNYLIFKEDGGDFESFITNMDRNVSLRLPFTSGHSTPAHHTTKDDDNESTCTSIRNFMTDILEGEEMAPTEARIIREVIEEEADVLDDSLDSHWLQDDITIGSDFDGVFGISPFGTPRSAQNNICYTPRSIDEAKQREINYLTSKEIIEKIDKPRISQKFDMPLLENMDLEDEESRPLNKTEIDEFINEDIAVKSNAPDLHEFDNSIPSEVEDMVTENSISNTLQCFKTDLLKDLAAKKQMDILENDNPSFVTYDKNIASSKLSLDNTVTNAASTDNDMCIILSQGTTEKKVEVPLTNELDFYVNKAELKKHITSVNDQKEYHCIIDRNLEIALKNAGSKEFSLDQLIVTPAVSIRSGVSTPTINNILFGDKDTGTQPSTSTPIRNTLFGCKHDTKTVPKYFPQIGQNIEDFDDDKSNIKLDDYLNNKYNKTDNKCTIQIKPDTDFDISIAPKQEVTDKQIKSDHNEVLEEFLRDAENDRMELNEEMIAEIIDPQELSKGLSDKDLFKRPLTPPSDKYDLKNCICRICDKKFTSCKSLKIHVARKHKYRFPNTDQFRNNSHKSMVRICEVCGKDVKGGSSNYKRHYLSHQKKEVQFFYCNDCPLFYRSRNSLVVHMKVHNNSSRFKKPKKYLCNTCGKISGNISHHKAHLKIHLEKPPISCASCNQGFYSNHALNEHIRTRHNGERPYECEECSKRFKRRESLNYHMKRHMGTFEFKCDVCSVEYVSKIGLAQHYASKKCIENRKKMNPLKSNEKVTVRYGKGSLEKIKAKVLGIEKEEIMQMENAEEIEESMIHFSDTESEAEISIPECAIKETE